MVSTMIVHVIGIAALSSILVAVIIHTSLITQSMVNENIKRVLNDIANTLVLQIRYAMNTGNNITLSLDYPVLVGNDRTYNIYLGTGHAIHKLYSWSTIPDDDNIYVFLIEPRSNIYAYSLVSPSYSNGYNITLPSDPLIFGSTIAVSLKITVVGNVMNITIIRGEVIYH